MPAHQTSSALNAGPNPTTLESLQSHYHYGQYASTQRRRITFFDLTLYRSGIYV